MKVITNHKELIHGKNYWVRLKSNPKNVIIRTCWVGTGITCVVDGTNIDMQSPFNEKIFTVYDVIGPIEMPNTPDFNNLMKETP